MSLSSQERALDELFEAASQEQTPTVDLSSVETVNALSEGYIVNVKFKQGHSSSYGGRTYSYQTTIEGFVEGDFAIVESPSEGYVVVKVVGVEQYNDNATKHIVSRVDVSEHKARALKVKRKKEILKKVSAMKAEFKDTALLQFMAKSSPKAKALLDELEGL